MGTDVLVSSARRSGFGPSVCRVGRGMWAWQLRCSRLGLVDGCSCEIGPSSSVKNVMGFWCRSRGVSMAWSLLSAQARSRQSGIRGSGWGWYDILGVCITGRGPRAPWNWVKYPSRMKGVDIEDETWSGGTELSLDRDQGHELSSYWELHFGVRHNKKKSYGFKERISWYRRGGYSLVLKQVVERGEEATTSPVGLSYPKSKASVRKEVDWRSTTVPQRQIYQLRRKGCRCKAKDSRAMSLAAPWYHRGGTSVESSIPCSHGGRALVVKGAEEVEYSKANSKYQDRTEGQRPRNFIRPVSMDFSSR
ncbi:hypothetical protein BHE74_00049572 [Ensete ventricosum]|nr:hypothetical protein BHE74_00049572 [Ensete ventricosum]